MNRAIKIFQILAFIAACIFMPTVIFADSPTQININTNIPGQNAATGAGAPGAVIANFYQFALLMAGILAFGAIVYGGIKYAVGRGNPSSESEGKSWITNALLGLLLLAGAYIILRTVNPKILLGLSLPGLPQVAVPSPGAPTTGVAPSCASGLCESLASAGLTCKPATQQPGGVDSCSAAQGMATTLQCIRQQGAPGFTITEAMPPTVPHLSSCHNNGCCVDVRVNSGTCGDVQALMSAVRACGATAANEYTACGGRTYETTSGNNVHINSAPGGGC